MVPEKWSPQWGFKLTTLQPFSFESSALTTRPWLLTVQCLKVAVSKHNLHHCHLILFLIILTYFTNIYLHQLLVIE
jgi:hypothetical protein